MTTSASSPWCAEGVCWLMKPHRLPPAVLSMVCGVHCHASLCRQTSCLITLDSSIETHLDSRRRPLCPRSQSAPSHVPPSLPIFCSRTAICHQGVMHSTPFHIYANPSFPLLLSVSSPLIVFSSVPPSRLSVSPPPLYFSLTLRPGFYLPAHISSSLLLLLLPLSFHVLSVRVFT